MQELTVSQDISGRVQTVLGPVDPSALGLTSMHEHALIDVRCYFQMPDEATERWYVDAPVTMDILGNLGKRWWYNQDNNTLLDEGVQTEELRRWFLAGGGSVVDTTSIGIARDPLALARISRATGVNVVMGASHYVPLTYTEDLRCRSEDEIAESIIRDITVGVGDTGIRAGIIGEVGNFWPTSETSRKILRASARASAETGAAITLHPGFHDDALMHHMSDLVEAGADPSRIVMGHVDTMAIDAVRRVAETGAFVQYDTFGLEDTLWGEVAGQATPVPSDVERMERIEQLIDWGHEDRILIAHDVCFKSMLSRYGGKGYSHVLESIVPRMRRRGYSERSVRSILVDNPMRVLTFP